MKEYEAIMVFGLIAMLLFFSSSDIQKCPEPENVTVYIEKECNCINTTQYWKDNLEAGKYDFYTIKKDLGRLASEHEYELNKYDCTDFSCEVYNYIDETNYVSAYFIGNYKTGGIPHLFHTWTGVITPIESETGMLMGQQGFEEFDIDYVIINGELYERKKNILDFKRVLDDLNKRDDEFKYCNWSD